MVLCISYVSWIFRFCRMPLFFTVLICSALEIICSKVLIYFLEIVQSFVTHIHILSHETCTFSNFFLSTDKDFGRNIHLYLLLFSFSVSFLFTQCVYSLQENTHLFLIYLALLAFRHSLFLIQSSPSSASLTGMVNHASSHLAVSNSMYYFVCWYLPFHDERLSRIFFHCLPLSLLQRHLLRRHNMFQFFSSYNVAQKVIVSFWYLW